MVRAIREWIDHHGDDVMVIGVFLERLIGALLEGAHRIAIKLLLLAIAILAAWQFFTNHFR